MFTPMRFRHRARRGCLLGGTAALAVAMSLGALADRADAGAGDATCDAGSFAGGDGSAGSPFQVNNRASLDEVRDCADQYFLQIADIDLGSTEWTPIGSFSAWFGGTYDGAGHAITGLSITTASQNGIGLFGIVSGIIENLSVAGSITIGDCTGHSWVGGIVGWTAGSMQSAISSVDISASTCDRVGGVAGQAEVSMNQVAASGDVSGHDYVGGLIGFSYTAGVYRSIATGAVSGNSSIGGLIGATYELTMVDDSYARGSVTATAASTGTAGALIGTAAGTLRLQRSYATGTVTAPVKGGLLGGSAVDYGTVEANFWDVTTTGVATDALPAGTTGLPSAPLKLLPTYTDALWDIDTSGEKVWQMCQGANDNYPFLSWEGLVESDCTEPVPPAPPPPSTLPPTGSGRPDGPVGLGAVLLFAGAAMTAVAVPRRRPSA